jgi:hypothetical protein
VYSLKGVLKKTFCSVLNLLLIINTEIKPKIEYNFKFYDKFDAKLRNHIKSIEKDLPKNLKSCFPEFNGCKVLTKR